VGPPSLDAAATPSLRHCREEARKRREEEKKKQKKERDGRNALAPIEIMKSQRLLAWT